MSRAPFQVLVIPYRQISHRRYEYAVFFRQTLQFGDFWQPIAGGGEDNETSLEAARREANEEGGLSYETPFIQLDSIATIPAPQAAGMLWGPDLLVVPEYTFGADTGEQEIIISHEHENFCWVDYDSAHAMLLFDSNKNALWELNYRLTIDKKA
jgi:dATP pyrophosphohydrolase